MKPENTYSPVSSLFSKQLNLSDFGFEKPALKKIKEINKDIRPNKLLKFIQYIFKYSKIVLNKYSSHFSKHDFTQPVLFTLLAVKIYTRTTYRQITDLLELSDKIQKYLHLKKVPHYTTLQKFFKRLPTAALQELNKQILINNKINGEIIVLDGSGFTNDYADKYYAIIRWKERKSYVKNHISIDVDSRLILHFAAQRGPRFDTRFAIAAIRNVKKFNPKYILADRAYDTEPIRKCINEEAKAEDQIPLKTRAKTGHYRLKSKNTFNQEIYSRRNNVESIFSVIKRIFNGTNRSRSLQLSNKETKLKNTIYNIYRLTQIQWNWGFLQSQKNKKQTKFSKNKNQLKNFASIPQNWIMS